MTEFQVIDRHTGALRDCNPQELAALTAAIDTPAAGRQTFFVAPDGHGEPTLWAHWDDPEDPEDPHAVLRRRDLGTQAHHWEEIVRRIVAAGSDPYA